jgi:head-tail adaptor
LALKTISGYAPLGEMDRQVDIWDQPGPQALPVLVAAGVWAKIATVATTTLSPASEELGQTNVWPRILGQDVSQNPHMVTIRYMPGLLSRMFLIYNDPDNGARRFDIDRIVDPDEHKFELRILAIERKDGAMDPFDALLTTTADILTRDTTGDDPRGMASPSFTTIASGIACRLAEGRGTPRGKKERAKDKLAFMFHEVFMRPWFLDASPDGSYIPYWVNGGKTYNTQPLTQDHWLLIPSASAINTNNQAAPGAMYDITDIDNPGAANHHIEVWCQVLVK